MDTIASCVDVDHQLLGLKQNCLDSYSKRSAIRAKALLPVTTIDRMTHELHRLSDLDDCYIHFAEYAALYSALTLRGKPYDPRDISLAYPLLLLSAWIFDDLLDTNKEYAQNNGLADSILEAISRRFTNNGDNHEAEIASLIADRTYPGYMRQWLAAILTLLHDYMIRIEVYPTAFLLRIHMQSRLFYQSFADKIRLTHFSGHNSEEYLSNRRVSIGMRPCFELSYALKLHDMDAPANALDGYFERNPKAVKASDLATEHCIGINDLFSCYKDRLFENTLNLPAVLSNGPRLEDYFHGLLMTIDYVRDVHRRFEETCAQLPEDDPITDVLIQTWQHMMEGNLLFHLAVPRYAKSVPIVKALLDRSMSHKKQRRLFDATMISA